MHSCEAPRREKVEEKINGSDVLCGRLGSLSFDLLLLTYVSYFVIISSWLFIRSKTTLEEMLLLLRNHYETNRGYGLANNDINMPKYFKPLINEPNLSLCLSDYISSAFVRVISRVKTI